MSALDFVAPDLVAPDTTDPPPGAPSERDPSRAFIAALRRIQTLASLDALTDAERAEVPLLRRSLGATEDRMLETLETLLDERPLLETPFRRNSDIPLPRALDDMAFVSEVDAEGAELERVVVVEGIARHALPVFVRVRPVSQDPVAATVSPSPASDGVLVVTRGKDLDSSDPATALSLRLVEDLIARPAEVQERDVRLLVRILPPTIHTILVCDPASRTASHFLSYATNAIQPGVIYACADLGLFVHLSACERAAALAGYTLNHPPAEVAQTICEMVPDDAVALRARALQVKLLVDLFFED